MMIRFLLQGLKNKVLGDENGCDIEAYHSGCLLSIRLHHNMCKWQSSCTRKSSIAYRGVTHKHFVSTISTLQDIDLVNVNTLPCLSSLVLVLSYYN